MHCLHSYINSQPLVQYTFKHRTHIPWPWGLPQSPADHGELDKFLWLHGFMTLSLTDAGHIRDTLPMRDAGTADDRPAMW